VAATTRIEDFVSPVISDNGSGDQRPDGEVALAFVPDAYSIERWSRPPAERKATLS
jgi:hypothetical protein